MKIKKKEFGERLKNFRKQRSLSQTELADILETTQGNIGHIENGRRKPGPDVLLNLYLAFQTDFQYLLLGNQLPDTVPLSNGYLKEPEPFASPGQYAEEYIKSRLLEVLRSIF
ncbi:MAG: helix-turn-helix transcriptional regulator [Calditrichota bacterium]